MQLQETEFHRARKSVKNVFFVCVTLTRYEIQIKNTFASQLEGKKCNAFRSFSVFKDKVTQVFGLMLSFLRA